MKINILTIVLLGLGVFNSKSPLYVAGTVNYT